jgi:hypothetical protein
MLSLIAGNGPYSGSSSSQPQKASKQHTTKNGTSRERHSRMAEIKHRNEIMKAGQ